MEGTGQLHEEKKNVISFYSKASITNHDTFQKKVISAAEQYWNEFPTASYILGVKVYIKEGITEAYVFCRLSYPHT